MIPKKVSNSDNPADYRPISVTSCLGKLFERLVTARLYSFVEREKLLSTCQSGFRSHRSTTDNLMFFTQKIAESFCRRKNVCSIFFDISKAFDKVWHDGLIYKMYQLKIPLYLINFTRSFLQDRYFIVNVNNQLSNPSKIKAGVPQGSVISPLLFNIYINDIPLKNSQNNSYSILYADDLVSFFIFKKTGNLQNQINKYLKEVEQWLCKWKMRMSAKKCNYTVFSRNKKQISTLRFKLSLFNEYIPFEKNPTFLGITFDQFLCFNKHIQIINAKTTKRLNVIKILAGKNWNLDQKLLVRIYKLLVGSIFDYSHFCANNISKFWLNRMQSIQNSAIRSIFKLPYDTPSNTLYTTAKTLKLDTVESRLFSLNRNYISRSIDNSNPLIVQLIDEYRRGFSARLVNNPTPLCASNTLLENFFQGINIFNDID